jgi:hypothetical protein
MLNDSGRDNVRPERVPHPLLAVVVCTALTGVVCLALVALAPGPSPLGLSLFGSVTAGRDPGAVPAGAAAVAPTVVPDAVSATVGPADAPMPRADGAVEVKGVVLAAYQTAVSQAPASCGLDVSLLAAIGQVESGNLSDHRLDADHRPSPLVLGPVLDGTNGLPALPDTDGGAWDGDSTWDRAMGPLQFVPNGWRLAGVDLDADGESNPQDIEDAAGAAMVFLCARGDDLSARSGLRSAVFAYNPAPSYVRLVLAWKAAFAADGLDLAEAELPELNEVQSARISRDLVISTARTADALATSQPAATPYQYPGGTGDYPAGDDPDPSAGPTPDAPGPPRPGATPPGVHPPGGGGPPGASPTPPPPGSAEPAPDPPTDPTPSDPTPSDPTPTDPEPSDPTPSDPEPSDPEPSDPTPSDPEPSDPAPSDPAPSDPTPSDPEPSDPAPSDPAPSDPAPSESPSPSVTAPTEPSVTTQPSARAAPQ